MNGPRSTYLAVAGHELHVTEWGEPGRPALVMWHGLARTGRDFDEAASALSDRYLVLCPDTIGRGLSSWAKNAEADYAFDSYGVLAVAMLDRYGLEQTRWLGTSMGGLIGVTLAAGALQGRITHLVVNDAGPDIPATGMGRIADYVGSPPVFDTVAEMEAWLRRNYAPFGDNSDAFWRRMADTSVRRTDAGRVTVHYDPNIAMQLTVHRADLDIWAAWDRVEAKTLLVRGERSDVLAAATAAAMTQRGPRPELVTVPGVGHAPTLATERDIALLRSFFER